MTVTVWSEPFEIPLHEIRHKPVLPCGLGVFTLFSIAEKIRNSHEPLPPVQVRLCDETGMWLLLEGRHRWAAHLLVGKPTILAVQEIQP